MKYYPQGTVFFYAGLSRDVGLFGVHSEPFSGVLTVTGPKVTPADIHKNVEEEGKKTSGCAEVCLTALNIISIGEE